jgi:transposase-like protein
MKEKTRKEEQPSRVVFEGLEAMVRQKIQGWLQDLLDEELTDFLGRNKSERLDQVDECRVYRNGHGRPRKLTMTSGTIEVKRPRLRGDAELEERFKSRLLPLFTKRTKEVDALLPELYLHGLSEGDFDLALRGLLGEDAPISPRVLTRLKEKWKTELEEWNERSLADSQVVYMWVDGVYVKAGIEKRKAALLVVLGARVDGTKEVLAMTPGHRESKEGWANVLRDLEKRGLACPKLVIGDGHLGIWAALSSVYPDADEQRCWNHRILNVLDKIPKKLQNQGKLLLKQIPYAKTKASAESLKAKFQSWCEKKDCVAAGELLDVDWEWMIAFYRLSPATLKRGKFGIHKRFLDHKLTFVI